MALPVEEIYTYRLPDHLIDQARPGMRVLVPFGNRKVTGYIIGPAEASDPLAIKQVLDLLDDTALFPETMLPFFQWIAGYYIYPPGLVINTALPGGLNLKDIAVLHRQYDDGPAAVTTPLEEQILAALDKGPATTRQLQTAIGQPVSWALIHQLRRKKLLRVERQLSAGAIGPKTVRMVSRQGCGPLEGRVSAQRQAICEILETEGDLSLPELKKRIPTAPALVRAMAKAEQVTLFEKVAYRDPFGDPIEPDTPPELTDEQAEAVAAMVPRLGDGFAPMLLDGVTGSGKTEVYLRLTRAALNQGLSVVVLVPEISLISQTERRFRARFGEAVAVLHSGLSRGERYDQWLRIARKEVQVAIGARSCIFAPFERVGLVIVDEEHDGSYKQESGLRYNARDLALVRGRFDQALVVLGSATPSVQSWHNVQTGKYNAVHLANRVNQKPLPTIETVDLSNNRDVRGIDRHITARLQQELKHTLDAGNQALIFLNRRGFAACPICGDCGQPMRCKNCDISLTLHKRANAFLCHYCGFSRAANSTCPSCGSEKIILLGVGTEKIQEAIEQLFPQARVARMDRDTMSRKGSMVRLLKQLRDREIDILVGTQMVAKGHDFPGITLVGVICADATLHFPDFRASERTFQLLAQVAGRAGRGDQPGKVVLQTFNPDHFSIVAACAQDFKSFYKEEIPFRQALGYPPATRMIALRISGKDARQTAAYAQQLGQQVRTLLANAPVQKSGVRIMGPIEAPLSRIAKYHRWQLLAVGPTVAELHALVRQLLRRPVHRSVRVGVDVDPFFLM